MKLTVDLEEPTEIGEALDILMLHLSAVYPDYYEEWCDDLNWIDDNITEEEFEMSTQNDENRGMCEVMNQAGEIISSKGMKPTNPVKSEVKESIVNTLTDAVKPPADPVKHDTSPLPLASYDTTKLDSAGLPHDKRVDSTSHNTNADGTWKALKQPSKFEKAEWVSYRETVKVNLARMLQDINVAETAPVSPSIFDTPKTDDTWTLSTLTNAMNDEYEAGKWDLDVFHGHLKTIGVDDFHDIKESDTGKINSLANLLGYNS